MITFGHLLHRRFGTHDEADPVASPTPRSLRATRASNARVSLAVVLHQARFELLGFARNRQARFFTVMLPLLFLVILVTVFGNESVGPQHVRSATYYVPGIAAMAVIAASFVNLVMSIISERETGVLKRRRVTPVSAWVLIAGRAASTMAVSLAVMIALLLVGSVVYGVDLPASSLPAVTFIGLVGSAAFAIVGYAVAGLIGSADGAQPIVQAIVLPLYFISGVFTPSMSLPTWLQDVGRVFPVEHLANGLHTALDPTASGVAIAWGDVEVMAVWAVVGLVVALRRFSWVPAAMRG